MNPAYSLYERLNSSVPQRFKTRIRGTLEHLLTLGKKSYFSQFGEDAILQGYFEEKAWQQRDRRSLPFIKHKLRPGYYVDVGAFSPIQFSNTYWFYTQGWRGINIDATPGSMKSFKASRKRDTNIEVAVSDAEKELTFYCWSVPSVVNTLSVERVPELVEQMGKEPTEVRVKAMPLGAILDEHLPRDQKIDFLSIDVEGHDLEVLQSNNWKKYRPELIIAEDLKDDIEEIVHSDISIYLKERGYRICSWARPSVIYKDEAL